MIIELVCVVRPEMNPELGIDEPLYVRPGVASQVDIRAALRKMIPDYEEMALRSIEARLSVTATDTSESQERLLEMTGDGQGP